MYNKNPIILPTMMIGNMKVTILIKTKIAIPTAIQSANKSHANKFFILYY